MTTTHEHQDVLQSLLELCPVTGELRWRENPAHVELEAKLASHKAKQTREAAQ
jgi:hypothetical protein